MAGSGILRKADGWSDLRAASELGVKFIDSHNENAKSFVWTATAEDILAKIAKCRKRLEETSPGCTSRKQRKVA